MFSGLTNQVSNWMGKKNEEGGAEMPPTEKVISPVAETEADMKKDNQGGSKLEMLAGVKSQMTGWLGGIPKLSRPGGQGPAEGEARAPVPEGQTAPNVEAAPSAEPVKDDDASSATSGADSGPVSLEGTPTDDKNGQQSFGAVSTKALASAKSLGGFLYDAVNKAGKTVVEASAKIKKTVEENRIIADLNKEQDALIASKQGEKGEAVAPWVGAPNEDVLREECLSLSTDRNNFVRAPPQGAEFAWDFEAVQPMAQATLALDLNLAKRRFELVPKHISEENFWRNYFYRVSVLRHIHELNTMASQDENNQTVTSAGSVDQVQVTTGQEASVIMTESSNNTLADSPGHEFVSDSMRVSDTDLEEVREGMKKLGMQPPKEEDWERELEAELKDYEVVTSGQDRNVVPTTTVVTGIDRDELEKQIDELLANEDDEDLK